MLFKTQVLYLQKGYNKDFQIIIVAKIKCKQQYIKRTLKTWKPYSIQNM